MEDTLISLQLRGLICRAVRLCGRLIVGRRLGEAERSRSAQRAAQEGSQTASYRLHT
jgi:hypothetical protein